MDQDTLLEIKPALVQASNWLRGIRDASARSSILRYGIALFCTVIAFFTRYYVDPILGPASPFMLFAPASLIAAGFAGLRPGFATMVAGLALGDYFFTPPSGAWGPYTSVELIQMATYATTTSVGVVVLHLLRLSMQRTESAAMEARERSQELEEEVTERKRVELALQRAKEDLESQVCERTAHLQESLRSLESVLYHVAHDLRAPLRAMEGFTSILLQQYGSVANSDDRDCARRITEAAFRMDLLLMDVLEYGRICHIEIIEEEIKLEETVTSVVGRFTNQAQKRAAEIHIDRPMLMVRADSQLLEIVVTNLVANALDYVPQDRQPRVRLWSEAKDDHVRLWVEDNGTGVEPQHFERIFRVFERLNPMGTAAAGTGIGLAIVQKAMKRMGGDVGLESGPDGCRF